MLDHQFLIEIGYPWTRTNPAVFKKPLLFRAGRAMLDTPGGKKSCKNLQLRTGALEITNLSMAKMLDLEKSHDINGNC